jgi:flagellar motor switch protein FliM
MSEAPATESAEAAKARISDDEVDALLEKVEAGAVTPGKVRGAAAEPYDLVAPDKIVRGRMPALDRINERWVGDFQRKVVEVVRRPVEMSIREVHVASYGEWQAALPALSSLNVYTVTPWRRNVLIAVDGQLLFAFVDAYYGGAGHSGEAPHRENLTPTERRLNSMLVALVANHFKSAFEPIAALNFEHQKTEVNPNYVQIATSSETVAITRIDVSVMGTDGTISLVMPLSMLEPVREKLSEGMQNVSKETKQRWFQTLCAQLERTELEMTSVFLKTELTLRELLQLKPGDILPIEMPKTATLFAGSEPLLTGKFGLSRGYNAISIAETAREAWARDKEDYST